MGSEKVLENFSRGPGKSWKSPGFFPVKEWESWPQADAAAYAELQLLHCYIGQVYSDESCRHEERERVVYEMYMK